jgi:hypothetical protein
MCPSCVHYVNMARLNICVHGKHFFLYKIRGLIFVECSSFEYFRMLKKTQLSIGLATYTFLLNLIGRDGRNARPCVSLLIHIPYPFKDFCETWCQCYAIRGLFSFWILNFFPLIILTWRTANFVGGNNCTLILWRWNYQIFLKSGLLSTWLQDMTPQKTVILSNFCFVHCQKHAYVKA